MFSPTFSKSTSFHAESGHSQIRRRKISYFANRHAEKKINCLVIAKIHKI